MISFVLCNFESQGGPFAYNILIPFSSFEQNLGKNMCNSYYGFISQKLLISLT